MDSSLTTAREKLAHAQTMLTLAEAGWNGFKDFQRGVDLRMDVAMDISYAHVQEWQAEVVLWQRVIDNADMQKDNNDI